VLDLLLLNQRTNLRNMEIGMTPVIMIMQDLSKKLSIIEKHL